MTFVGLTENTINGKQRTSVCGLSVGCIKLNLILCITLIIDEEFVRFVDNDEVDGVVCISLNE